MSSKRARLDRFISGQTGIKRGDIRLLLAQGRISVDGEPAVAINQQIDQFSRIVFDDTLLQANTAVYLMMNKPRGVVSATLDPHHTTVIELLSGTIPAALHIAGRLDFNSTGLLLLTNDGRWSRHLSLPERNIGKRYLVTLAKPLSSEYVDAFASGMHFDYENITTRPAQLEIIDDHHAEVTLVEGRYHQIKRMFGRFNNPVQALHRVAVGDLQLDIHLAPGATRDLTPAELQALGRSGTPGSQAPAPPPG